MKLKRYITEAGQTGMGADGLSKQKLRTLIYKETKKVTHNKLYSDSGWNGPQAIWDVFNKLDLNWNIKKSEYKHDKSSGSPMPTSKVWDFEIIWDNDKGKMMKMGGNLTAAGAGSVDQPLDKYDLVLILW
jgi:hypothetical protein